MAEKNDWTPETLEKLKILMTQGLSTSDIANKLGISKNAVVGKLNRMYLNTSQYQTFPHLIAVFVVNHKSIKNRLYNFSNKYQVHMHGYNNDNLDFRIQRTGGSTTVAVPDYNLRIIVGRNGAGKTSLVESLRMEAYKSKYNRKWNDEIDGAIYFCASDSGGFAWYYRGTVDSDKYHCTNIYREMKPVTDSNFLVSNQRTIQSEYSSVMELINLYSTYGSPAFFTQEHIDFDYLSFVPSEEFFRVRRKRENDFLYELCHSNSNTEYPELHFLYYVLFLQMLQRKDNLIDISTGFIKTYDDLERWHNDMVRSLFNPSSAGVYEIVERLNDFFAAMDIDVMGYDISSRVKVSLKSDKLLDYFKLDLREFNNSNKLTVSDYMTRRMRRFNIPDWILDNLFQVEFLRFNPSNKTFYKFSDLSTGEQSILATFAEIFNQISDIGERSRNNMVIVLDEPTNSLHPEWQRKFIYYLNDFIKHMPMQYRKRIDNVIITTHSPFILTDVSKNEIIFLPDKNQTQDIENIPNTFAGNIHALLARPFFMENGTVGEYATRKIAEIVDFYNQPIEKIVAAKQQQQNYQELLNMMANDNLIKIVLMDKINKKIGNN